MKAEYIDHMGDDLAVVNAARVSFAKESEWEYDLIPMEYQGYVSRQARLSERDTKLIRFLARNNHFTPFTHCMITLRETVPIFVARQRFKHTVGFTYNEVSRRYVDDTPRFHFPVWRERAENKKQGSAEEVDIDQMISTTDAVSAYYQMATELYEALLKDGIAPEQARAILPQSMMTSYYVTGSLAAFARFYNQRTDSHAQKEIQELAKQVGKIIEPLFPVSWAALTSTDN